LSYLRFQPAGMTGTNRPCQDVFSTAGRTSFAGRITKIASAIQPLHAGGVHIWLLERGGLEPVHPCISHYHTEDLL